MKTPFLVYITYASSVPPAAVGVYHWKRLPKHYRILTVFFCLTILYCIAEEWLYQLNINNLFLEDIFQLVELEVFLLFYWIYDSNITLRKIILSSGVLYVAFWIVYELYFGNQSKFNEAINTWAYFILLPISLFILLRLSSELNKRIIGHAVFWISGGIALYCAATLFIFSFSNEILQIGFTYFLAAWYTNWVSIIIVNAMFTRSFWCKIL
jgi:hypothetical protein